MENKAVEEPIEEVIVEPVAEPREERTSRGGFDKESWQPKTSIGKKIKSGELNDIDTILESGTKILESGVVDALLPSLEADLIAIGQSRGKFGGGKRSIWRQTQKKTKEGNKPRFGALTVVGNKAGIIGIGRGKAKETVPAREKSLKQAKLSIIKISRGCGSWECNCSTKHSIPFRVEGKCGSCRIKLLPAPKGTGLRVEKECQKLLTLAGVKDVYSKTFGQTGTKINLIYACFYALKKLKSTKLTKDLTKKLGSSEDE